MKLGWKNGEIINALQKFYEGNDPKKSTASERITICKMGWDYIEGKPHWSRLSTSIVEEKN